eukprot:TRINITY_DN3603_c0_g1_i1.p1 TRINITY_DN3603_c0_g1~~TRINITY_DN3603_c0_g1_i1.p1  ORF type:complete len:489 (+),score=116.78 TRINITY_DN3603_c0_g1_i1:1494-2960(+)
MDDLSHNNGVLEIGLSTSSVGADLELRIAKQLSQLKNLNLISKIDLKNASFEGVKSFIKAIVQATADHNKESEQHSILETLVISIHNLRAQDEVKWQADSKSNELLPTTLAGGATSKIDDFEKLIPVEQLFWTSSTIYHSWIDSFLKIPNLKTLSLNGTVLGGDLSSLPFRKLTEGLILHKGISRDDIGVILRQLPVEIRRLELLHVEVPAEDLIEFVERAPLLSQLSLQESLLNEFEVIDVLRALQNSKYLTDLDLSELPLTEEASDLVSHLLKKPTCRLITLNLNCCFLKTYVDPKVAKAKEIVAALEFNCSLKHLNLGQRTGYITLGLETFQKLMESLVKNTELVSLNLSNMQLGRASAGAILEALESNYCLSEIILSGNPGIPFSLLSLIEEKLERNKNIAFILRIQIILIYAQRVQNFLDRNCLKMIMEMFDKLTPQKVKTVKDFLANPRYSSLLATVTTVVKDPIRSPRLARTRTSEFSEYR